MAVARLGDTQEHVTHFSLYVPKTNGKLRCERKLHANLREEATRLWQAFCDEISGNPPAPEQSAEPKTMTSARS